MSVSSDALVADFMAYVSERVSQVEQRKRRIDQLVGFLANDQVAKCKLRVKVQFLSERGFSSLEIETAFEQIGNEKDYLQVLERKFDSDDDGETGRSYRMQQNDASKHGDALWRVGSTIYAYRGNHVYCPVPLMGIDEIRGEDKFAVAHLQENGEYGEFQYYAAGFKGVVPDEFAPYAAVQIGATVIAEVDVQTSALGNHFMEAVVLAKSKLLAGDDFTVDVEWVHDSSVTRGIDWRSIRLLLHPKEILVELERDEEWRRQNCGSMDRILSTSSFPNMGLEGKMSEIPDKHRLTAQLRNFLHYPALDVGEQMRHMRTGASFVSQFGEMANDGSRYSPLCPPSQEDLSSIGFGFNLSCMQRAPRSRLYFVRNPIVEVAEQCTMRDSMFVDPDFPPSLRSLYGAAASSASPTAPQAIIGETVVQIVWKRMSECMYRPRVNVVGSKPLELQPGHFTPPWMTNVIVSLQETAEFEELISPEEDGWVYGAYVVKFFVDGRWCFVLVDDFIPCDAHTGSPLCLLSSNTNEIYCCIIEKALAKLEGSYSALKYPRAALNMHQLWEDITSNMSEAFDHDLVSAKDAVNDNMQAAVTREAKYCQIHTQCRGDDERDAEFGFEKGTYWLVDKVTQFLPPTRKAPQYFYHVVRPPHVGPVVSSIEALRERFFQMMPAEAIDTFPEVRDNAVSYWLASADYFRIFDRTVLLWYFNNVQKLTFDGSFANREEICAKVDSTARWLTNPQIYLSFVQPTSVLIELKLLDPRIRPPGRIKGRILQLHLLRGLLSERPLSDGDGVVAASPAVDLVDDEQVKARPSTTMRLQLSSGNYVLIPSVGCPSDERFIIKVCSIAAFSMKLLN